MFLLISYAGYSTHIVGGEIEMEYRGNFRYRFRLIMYFDVLNGSSGAFDSQTTLTVFRKSNNQRIQDIILPFVSRGRVEYFQPDCSNGEVVTDKIIYEAEATLLPETYFEEEGYYVVWQRCCRNYTISNIYSEDPNFPGARFAGQTFYLEFPPVVLPNGIPLANSSPQLFPPLNDYACPFKEYWVDFAGTDPDGDSLVYSLTAPLSTPTGEAIPVNASAPYPTILWKPGFGLNNIVNGNPDLRISSDGFLNVTPKSQGLFVFAVKVEEYRYGIKIGEVRRDFQLFVVDKCPEAQKPVIMGKKIADPGYTYIEEMSVTFGDVSDTDRCIQVRVSDPDALKASDNFTEKITIKAVPLNFKAAVADILPEVKNATLVNGSTAVFDICFPECPYLAFEPYEIGIVALDDACALPLTDTLRVSVSVPPPPNEKPYFVPGDLDIVLTPEFNGTYTADIVARDPEGQPMSLQIFPLGFYPQLIGMSFEKYKDVPGEIRTTLRWDVDCSIDPTIFDEKKSFDIIFEADDEDLCLLADPARLVVNAKIQFLDKTYPPLTFTSVNSFTEITGNTGITNVNSPVDIFVSATDQENGLLTLELISVIVDGKDVLEGFEFQNASAIKTVGSHLVWTPECSIFVEEQTETTYTFIFGLRDQDCLFDVFETHEFTLTVKEDDPPPPLDEVPNVITPNNDGKNEFFAIQWTNGGGQIIHAVPFDRCASYFLEARIYNRWGREVFSSKDRDFKWYGDNAGFGVYYYIVQFSDKEYKGTVSVLK